MAALALCLCVRAAGENKFRKERRKEETSPQSYDWPNGDKNTGRKGFLPPYRNFGQIILPAPFKLAFLWKMNNMDFFTTFHNRSVW